MQLSHNIIDLVNYTQCKSTKMNWWPSIADIPNILHSIQRQILWIYNIFKLPNLCTFDVHRFSGKKKQEKITTFTSKRLMFTGYFTWSSFTNESAAANGDEGERQRWEWGELWSGLRSVVADDDEGER